MKIHQDNDGHMTKMAAMLIYDKNTLKIFFPGTMADFDETLYEETYKPFIFYSNYDLWLTLTYLWQD